MQVAKWGNSLAVRLPASVVDALGLKAGDEIEIHVADERDSGVSRKPGPKHRVVLHADDRLDPSRSIVEISTPSICSRHPRVNLGDQPLAIADPTSRGIVVGTVRPSTPIRNRFGFLRGGEITG